MTAALTEYDGRPGRVRDAVAEVWSRRREQLRADLTAAVDGELPAGVDIDQTLFEIVAAGLALNASMQLQHDRAAAGRARRAIERASDSSLGRAVTDSRTELRGFSRSCSVGPHSRMPA
ncbi:hypothetical protein OG528_31925 [Streptomyces platensis]